MAAPACTSCCGVFVCANCERPLRKQLAEMHEVDHLMMTAGVSSGGHRSFDESKLQALYTTTFPTGRRGGALIEFGNAIVLECFLPYKEPGLVLPFVPYPFDGRDVVHDIGRKREVTVSELDACALGRCRCDSRPTGWRLTRPIVRALLDVTDSWLNDHGRLLPGLIGSSWALAYDTRTFMEQVYFANFLLPKRDESRELRAERTRSRASAAWSHRHPEHDQRRRR